MLWQGVKTELRMRPYQLAAKLAVERTFGWVETPSDVEIVPAARTMIDLATGTGKTVTFAALANDAKGRVLVVAHRDELIEQAATKLREVTGDRVDIEKANDGADLWNPCRIVVGSVQTLNSIRNGRPRMERLEPDKYGLVIIDECHHATADSYRRVIAHFEKNPACRILGATATPDRADEESLGKIFRTVAYRYQLRDAIRDGYLCNVRCRSIPLDLSFASIKDTAGDFNQGELGAIMEEDGALHGVVKAVREQGEGRKSIIFGVRVKHAEQLAEIFNRDEPGSARSISGGTPKDERAAIVSQFRKGQFRYLCNVGVATEGFDVPDVGCVAVARPTQSRALYTQMIGRGTRPLYECTLFETPAERQAAIAASGKPDCLVIDFTDNARNHKLVSAIDILGDDYEDEIVVEAKRIAADKCVNPSDVLDIAAQELRRKRAADAARAAEEAIRKRRARVVVEGIEYEVQDVNPFDALDLPRPRVHGWDAMQGATEKQRKVIASRGFNPNGLTKAEASRLCDACLKLPSLKQKARLQKVGMWTEGMTSAEASNAMNALAGNGWRRPSWWGKKEAVRNG